MNIPLRIFAIAVIMTIGLALAAQGTHAPVVQRGEYKADPGAAAAHVMFLKLHTDASCRITINGKTELLKPGTERLVRLPKGTYALDIIDAADATNHAYTDQVVVDEDKLGKATSTDIYFHEPPLQKETGASETSGPGEIFTYVEEPPQYPEGEDSMMRFIKAHLKYPVMERDNGV